LFPIIWELYIIILKKIQIEDGTRHSRVGSRGTDQRERTSQDGQQTIELSMQIHHIFLLW